MSGPIRFGNSPDGATLGDNLLYGKIVGGDTFFYLADANGNETQLGPPWELVDTWNNRHSHQTVAADLYLAAGAGKNVADGTAFLAPFMGNLHSLNDSDVLTKTGNYLAGVIGAYSVPGAIASHYPVCAVLGLIMDGAGKADGIISSIDGDSTTVNGGSAFKVKCQNSTAASGFDFGLDLQDPTHDGFIPVDNAFFKKALVRLPGDVCIIEHAGVPTDGTTGKDVCGPGSLCCDTTNKKWYINGNTLASPTWKIITSA